MEESNKSLEKIIFALAILRSYKASNAVDKWKGEKGIAAEVFKILSNTDEYSIQRSKIYGVGYLSVRRDYELSIYYEESLALVAIIELESCSTANIILC